jgi:copper chaperone CopZ
MKKIILSFLLISLSMLGFSQFEKVELQASGLTCSMCSNAINKALKTLPFVESIQTDLNQNLFTIVLKRNMPIDFDAISKKVEGAGFSVAKCWVLADLHNLNLHNDEHIVLDGLNIHFMNVKSQTLNGPSRLQLIDKHFVQQKEYKRFSTLTAMTCYKTGMMAGCCASEHPQSMVASTRIYHVTI